MKNFFDITDYGASPEKGSNTGNIQKAIDECRESGGGRVVCPAGVFVTGPLELKTNVELYLGPGCVLEAEKDISVYGDFRAEGFVGERAPEKTTKYLFMAAGQENIGLTGPGAIDASGLAFYSREELLRRRKPARRPRTLMFYECTKVLIKGVSIIDSPCWTAWLMKCEDVTISGIRISGNPGLINNDGIDIDSCRRVTVSDCSIDTEDDCLVVRAINGVYSEPGVCSNVTVTNCVLSSRCNGVRIGCPGDGEIRDCAFSNVTVKSRVNGIIFENPRRYLRSGEASADVHDMVFSNFTVDCRGVPVLLSVEEGIKLKRLSGIKFSNFRIKGGAPCTVRGSSQTRIKDVSFTDIDIDTASGEAMSLGNCENIRLNNVNVLHAGAEPGEARESRARKTG